MNSARLRLRLQDKTGRPRGGICKAFVVSGPRRPSGRRTGFARQVRNNMSSFSYPDYGTGTQGRWS